MEQINKNENKIIEIPPVERGLSDTEVSTEGSDRIKYTSEQSGANMFSPGSNGPQDSQGDSTMALPVVDDGIAADSKNNPPKKIIITDGLTALDKDMIEKAWIVKAKAIIEESIGDPFKKNANLTAVKDQYKSARFNKLISSK